MQRHVPSRRAATPRIHRHPYRRHLAGVREVRRCGVARNQSSRHVVSAEQIEYPVRLYLADVNDVEITRELEQGRMQFRPETVRTAYASHIVQQQFFPAH